MKVITIAEFFKLPKKGPISGRSLEPGKLYYIHDIRDKSKSSSYRNICKTCYVSQ